MLGLNCSYITNDRSVFVLDVTIAWKAPCAKPHRINQFTTLDKSCVHSLSRLTAVHLCDVDLFQYLTTVIPYDEGQGPLSIEQLQMYIKSMLCYVTSRALYIYKLALLKRQVFFCLLCTVLRQLSTCHRVLIFVCVCSSDSDQ